MLGQGVYQLAEVSLYTGVPASTVRSWFKSQSDQRGLGPLFESDYPHAKQYSLSFLNLIDAYVAAFFRGQGVPALLIRKAYTILGKEINTVHPFAHADLYTDGRRIIRRAADRVGDATLTDVVSRQTWFPAMRHYLRSIVYSGETKLARQWNIADGVVIDPALRFGQPVVRSTGIPTYILARQYAANKNDADLVAAMFRVGRSDVLKAVQFERHIRAAA